MALTQGGRDGSSSGESAGGVSCTQFGSHHADAHGIISNELTVSGSFLFGRRAVVQHQGALMLVEERIEIHARLPSSVSGSARLSAAGAYEAIASDNCHMVSGSKITSAGSLLPQAPERPTPRLIERSGLGWSG